MLKRIALFLCACSATFAQTANVSVSKQPGSPAVTVLTFYNAGGNPQYICKALTSQPAFTWAVTPNSQQGTLTSIAVATNVGTATTGSAHGLQPGNVAVVSGSTTSALNATYVIQTVPSTTTFTITTSGVSDGTYNTAALSALTTAPRSSASIWSIESFTYNASGNPITDQWATSTTSTRGGTAAMTFICDNRASIGYN